MQKIALIVDDEVDLCRLIQITLTKMNIKSDVAYTVETAKEFLSNHTYDFCLTDLALPDGSGLELVKQIATHHVDTPVAVISAHGDVSTAIEALKLGAFDFVSKPLDLPSLRALVNAALKVRQDIDNTHSPKILQTPTQDTISTPKPSEPIPPISTPQATDDTLLERRLIGHSLPMQTLKHTIKKLARSQAPVFLWGGSGTGKEVVARLIHDLSPRRDGSFVPVNCGAIPSELMESEFFGHKKGSFTGATSDKIGLFQQADGGTLFLDEVADLPLAMQVKLLRAIQEKTVRAIGDTKEIPVDIRILCATHKDLAGLVKTGEFRQDLFYRINVIEVKLPTLNERRDDIPMLAKHFLKLICKDWQLDEVYLTKHATEVLSHHDYKGNVRELRNILERAITLSDSEVIDAAHLCLEEENIEVLEFSDTHDMPMLESSLSYQDTRQVYAPHYIKQEPLTLDIKSGVSIDSSANYGTKPSSTLPEEGLEAYLTEQEKHFISIALQKAHGNKTHAAKLLGMSFRSLRYRMSKLGLDSNDILEEMEAFNHHPPHV